MGLESPAGNIQHCFAELAQRKGHPIQHHYTAPRREVSSVISICLMSSIDGRFLNIQLCFVFGVALTNLLRLLDFGKVLRKMIFTMKLIIIIHDQKNMFTKKFLKMMGMYVQK